MPQQARSRMTNPAHIQQEKVITAGDLEAFTDELLTRQLDEYHIAGASVSIVQDGRIVARQRLRLC